MTKGVLLMKQCNTNPMNRPIEKWCNSQTDERIIFPRILSWSYPKRSIYFCIFSGCRPMCVTESQCWKQSSVTIDRVNPPAPFYLLFSVSVVTDVVLVYLFLWSGQICHHTSRISPVFDTFLFLTFPLFLFSMNMRLFTNSSRISFVFVFWSKSRFVCINKLNLL